MRRVEQIVEGLLTEMRVKIVRAKDNYVLQVRTVDEVAEQYGLSDAQADAMEAQLKSKGSYILDGKTKVVPA